jgi:hypothetical protein
MKFRVQTGSVKNGIWEQGDFDDPLDAMDFAKAKSKAPLHAMKSGWHEEGTWLRVIGDGQEYRWRPKEEN